MENIAAFDKSEVDMILSYLRNPYVSCSYGNPTAGATGQFTAKLNEQKIEVTVKATSYEAAAVINEVYYAIEKGDTESFNRILTAKTALMFPELLTRKK